MTAPDTTTTTTEPVAPPEGEPTTTSTDTPEVEPVKDPFDDLPEWAQKEIKQTRAEAANYRTKLREAEATLSNAKTPEEFEAAVAEVRAVNADLERAVAVERAARLNSLPDDLAEQLKYLPLDEIEARAKVLAKYVTAPAPTSLDGGLSPSPESDVDTSDPRALARRTRRR